MCPLVLVNEAVSRNPDKFPDGYILALTEKDKAELVANCDRLEAIKHSTVLPKAFTERVLYMLATILKSAKATETTWGMLRYCTKSNELISSLNFYNHHPA